jgi:VanZ family protein
MDRVAPSPPRGAADDGAPGMRSPWGEGQDRDRRRRRRTRAAGLLAVYVTLTPDSVDRGVYPFLMRGVLFIQFHGLPWFRYSMIEEAANVALFVPLGMLGILALGLRRWWRVVLTGTALSGSVELVQSAFLPGRVASVTDVVANGAGALVGVALCALLAARPRRGGGIRA